MDRARSDSAAGALQARERAAAVEATLEGTIAPALAALDAHLATHERVLRSKMPTEEASEAALTRALAETEVQGLSVILPTLLNLACQNLVL